MYSKEQIIKISNAVLNKEKSDVTKKDLERLCRVLINEEVSKTRLRQIASLILNKYDVNKKLNKDCANFLIKQIFSKHRNWIEKKGVGVSHIEIRTTISKTNCFYIVRTDGSLTDISFNSSVTDVIDKKRQDIYSACRNAIRPIKDDMRNKITLPFVCPIKNIVITDKKYIDIDHYNLTFLELFELWLKDKDKDYLHSKINKDCDGEVLTYFTDSEIINDFIDFHNKHTHLRAVSKSANLHELRKDYYKFCYI